MDNLEKVERLRERAAVSYEEAKTALEASNWDLLDAMVLLEKQGKTEGPKTSEYSTSYEQQETYIPVKKTVYDEKEQKERAKSSVRGLIGRFIRICKDNFFTVERKGEEVLRLPVSVLVLLLFFFWKFMLPVMVVMLFLGFRYSFEGKDQLEGAKKFMDSAGDMADYVKDEFTRKSDEQ